MSLEGPSTNPKTRMLVGFLLLSLVFHADLIAVILLFFNNSSAESVKEPEGITLNIVPMPAPDTRTKLADTMPDPDAPEPKNAQFESDNNTRLASKNNTTRSEDRVPDVHEKAPTQDLRTAEYAPPKDEPIAPPAPDKTDSKGAEHPITAKSVPQPSESKVTPQPQNPIAKTTPAPRPRPVKAQPVQLVDPNGLPVLPPLAASTVLPFQAQPVQSVRGGAPPPSLETQEGDVNGFASVSDHNSLEARRSDLGVYMAKVKRAIGSIWYPKVQNQTQLVSVGVVHVRVTIHSDGSVDVYPADAEDQGDRAMILRSLSMNSIKEAAPFDPFPESMRRDIGDSYTEEFSFQVYGAY